jgi:hypothetical protein
MRAWIAVFVLTFVGCAPGLAEFKRDMADLSARASFDLTCPEPSLTVLEERRAMATRVGALGCGRQVTYTRRLRTRALFFKTTENTSWRQAAPVAAVPAL